MRGNIKYIIIICSALLIFLLITCSEGNTPKNQLSSPIDTFITFIDAHNNCKEPSAVNKIDSTLSDDLIFVFNLDDFRNGANDGYMTPDSWNRDEFFTLTELMFNNAYSVSLSISGYENGNYSANHTEYNCETDFNLLVYDDVSYGYQATGTVNWRLKLCSDSNWRISQIYDNTSPDTLSLEITNAPWHEILLLFR